MILEPKENVQGFECSLIKEKNKREVGKRKTPSKMKQKDREKCPMVQKKKKKKKKKKARMVWTNILHNEFLTAIDKIGLANASPKRILKLMEGLGLSRRNVASHLQKHRLYLKTVVKDIQFGADPRNSSLILRSRPPFLYNGPQEFPHFSEQRNPLIPFQPRFEGNIHSFKAPSSMSPVALPQLCNKEVLSNNFMTQPRYRQLVPTGNQENTQQQWLGNASFVNQPKLGGYSVCGLCKYVNNSVVASNTKESIVPQQPKARPVYPPNPPLEQNLNSMNPDVQNSHPSPGNTGIGITGGSFDFWNQSPNVCHGNNCYPSNIYGKLQMTNPAVMNGQNRIGAFGSELSNVNPSVKRMNEIGKGKGIMESVEIPHCILKFNELSTSYATQGESSSSALLNPNQYQAMPPADQQHHGEENPDGLLDFITSSSPITFCNLLFNQRNQSKNQEQWGEVVMDPEFDISEYLIDGNSPTTM